MMIRDIVSKLLVAILPVLLMPTLLHAESYRYDAAGRLVGVTYDDSSTITYGYDSAGNRITLAATSNGAGSGADTGAGGNTGSSSGSTDTNTTNEGGSGGGGSLGIYLLALLLSLFYAIRRSPRM